MLRGRRFNYFIFALLVALLVLTVTHFQGSGGAYVGVATARPYTLNADRAGQVSRIAVVEGQQVARGDFLASISSDALTMNIDKLANRIEVLKAELSEKAKLTQSEINYIHAEADIEMGKVSTELLETQAEASLNQKLVERFEAKQPVDEENPMTVKIASLRAQQDQYRRASHIREADVRAENAVEQKLLTNQITLLTKELELMKQEYSKLTKFSGADGVVENVYVKEGEQVDAFTPILSVNPIHPTTVTAYLTVRKPKLAVGHEVTLRAMDNMFFTTSGRVIGYGSVVELPGILQKSTAVKAFGLEMFIAMDGENPFSAGEKIIIR